MADLESTARILLQDAGYRVRRSASSPEVLIFEDEGLLGFCYFFDDIASLLSSWKAKESETLSQHAMSFRAAGEKAWNVYSVFLTAADGSEPEKRKVRLLEENLERTRKICASSLTSRSAIRQALLPLLPLQYRASLSPEDVTTRLQQRIEQLAPKAKDAVLNESVAPEDAIAILWES